MCQFQLKESHKKIKKQNKENLNKMQSNRTAAAGHGMKNVLITIQKNRSGQRAETPTQHKIASNAKGEENGHQNKKIDIIFGVHHGEVFENKVGVADAAEW